MSWVDDKKSYVAFARQRHPAALLVTKDAWPWRVAAVFAAPFVGYASFLSSWATTFGPIMGYPRSLPSLSRRLLVHECEHTAQCEYLGWAMPVAGWFFGRKVRAWCGLPLFAALWAVGGLPIFFCPGRFFLERGADRVSWRWMLENGYDASAVRERGLAFAEKVCGRSYGWALPLMGRWLFRRAIEQEISKHGKKASLAA